MRPSRTHPRIHPCTRKHTLKILRFVHFLPSSSSYSAASSLSSSSSCFSAQSYDQVEVLAVGRDLSCGVECHIEGLVDSGTAHVKGIVPCASVSTCACVYVIYTRTNAHQQDQSNVYGRQQLSLY
eukprot:GHVU01211597.1.p1 GENE.GHVU01211597.1~~GHVU01211597.1.p1  ORF type:complete len:125 (-),score=3.41 GHVU01211597.1:106-480(-)